jgi:protein-tyrosine phosphatase
MPYAMLSTPQRHLSIEGTYNIRDIGGYATQGGRMTRWRTLFRADSLHRLSPQAQMALLDHHLQTVVDLRHPDELQAAPNVFAQATEVCYQNLSLLVDNPLCTHGASLPLAAIYRQILDESQEQLRTVLATLAKPGSLPAVVHCTAGKDRTGIVIALTLGLAGVPTATIVADYALTGLYLGPDFIEETRQHVMHQGYTWEQYEPLVVCSPADMRMALSYLEERYGGITAYVRTIGLSELEIARLRAALVI